MKIRAMVVTRLLLVPADLGHARPVPSFVITEEHKPSDITTEEQLLEWFDREADRHINDFKKQFVEFSNPEQAKWFKDVVTLATV